MSRQLIASLFVSLLCSRFGQMPIPPQAPPGTPFPTSHGWRCEGDGEHCIATGPDGATVILRPRSIARVLAYPTPTQARTLATIKCR